MSQSPYLPNTDADRRAMLDKIGVDSAEALFRDIPPVYLKARFDLPAPLSEPELKEELRRMSEWNIRGGVRTSFIGGGYYHHFIPAIVAHLTGRSEFYTAYTPYQAEVSQGTLQTLYEFQSMVAALTGMEVANAGLYDGSTAATEAALMACRITKREKIAVNDTVNPQYRDVIQTYARGHGLAMEIFHGDKLPGDAACAVLQQPDFLGCIDRIDSLIEKAHRNGVMVVVSVNPIALGMYRAPGDYGADIVVAEGQPLGNPVSFGGPGLGLFAGRKEHLRQMPGRLVGKTQDIDGRPGYVLTMATREQHIRREKATSNICTSEVLAAIAATVYLAAMGKTGLRRVAELCFHKAHYAAALIDRLPGYALALDRPFFNEFAVRCPQSPEKINRALAEKGITGGLDIGSLIPNGLLFCITEINTKNDIDNLVESLAGIGRGVK